MQYKGEQNDTYRANAYALKCMYAGLAVLIFCWILDVLNIFIVDLTIMSASTGGAIVCCLLAVLYARCIGIDSPSSRFIVMFLLVSMATVICTGLSYHTTLFMMFPMICSTLYFDKRMSWYTAILTCVGFTVAVLLGYHIGLCDTNMLLLSYTNSAFHSAALASGDFTINTNKALMFLFFAFPRWLIIFALMPLLNHVARDIQARTAREAMARHLAEIDGLTGVYNRNKYLQSIRDHYPTCQQVAVMFFDLNNLKQVNDTKGHEYGDMLICALADTLRGYETDTCKVYRIGGDEFVLILENSSRKNAEDVCAALDQDLQGKQPIEELPMSVAIGFAYGTGRDIEDSIREADEQMYQRKTVMKAALAT